MDRRCKSTSGLEYMAIKKMKETRRRMIPQRMIKMIWRLLSTPGVLKRYQDPFTRKLGPKFKGLKIKKKTHFKTANPKGPNYKRSV